MDGPGARRVELVAHRAGNVAEHLTAALALADAVELDVHRFRGRLEVRHAKVLWPFGLRWEQWHLVPRTTPRPTLAEILEIAGPDIHLWVDLKGFSPSLTRRVLAEVGDRTALTVSCRSWWVLRPARRRDRVRVMRSIGNRAQLWVALRFGRWLPPDGVTMHERFGAPDVVAALHRRAPAVVVWAVPDLERGLELVRAGVDGLIVDDLELVVALHAHLSAP